MKSIISINRKFMDVSPRDLVNLILNSKYTKGVEICVDMFSEEEMDYLEKLVFELKKNNLILQVHGNSDLSLENQIKFLKKLEKYSDYLEYPIVVTLHPFYDEDRAIAIKKINNYLSEVVNSISTDKIIINIENLNDMDGMDRLEKEALVPILSNISNLYFTYDIGHEIVDYGDINNLNDILIDRIRNVHIHTHNNMGIDHMPIYRNDSNWNIIIKAITYLNTIDYKYNVVFEYDLFACNGEKIEDKIISYLDSIDIVSEHF